MFSLSRAARASASAGLRAAAAARTPQPTRLFTPGAWSAPRPTAPAPSRKTVHQGIMDSMRQESPREMRPAPSLSDKEVKEAQEKYRLKMESTDHDGPIDPRDPEFLKDHKKYHKATMALASSGAIFGLPVLLATGSFQNMATQKMNMQNNDYKQMQTLDSQIISLDKNCWSTLQKAVSSIQ